MAAIEREAYARLERCGLRPSPQRLLIMEYLIGHLTHPTVEDIHKKLCQKVPTLSRTTVYNTLRLFAENGAAQMLTIDEHRVCYDGIVEPHAHFYCKKCGKIFDILISDANLLRESADLGGNKATEMQLYYRGTCAKCAESEQ